jgi:hypothetical protein
VTTSLRGTMLTPGVSANGRLYTPDLIRKAHQRLSERLTSGRPVTMLTHHAAGDDSRLIVGRVTGVTLNGPNLEYTARLADTTEASTIAGLLSPDDDGFLGNVSIRGWWLGETRQVDGCETADDLEIDGLDFTKSPGVTGATVRIAADSATTETAGRVLITETVDAVVFTETVKAPYGNVTYADPGYQSDKVKRYPVDTKAHAKAAWSYINQADKQKPYTPAQLKRIRGRIKAALKTFGVTVTTESLAGIAAIVPEVHMTETTLSECSACVDGTGTAGFSISAYNGPLTVTVSAYNGVEPADLGQVAMCAMQAACDAIHALDPDDDGDIDAGTSDMSEQSDDNQMETAPAVETVEEAVVADETAPEATNTDVVETVEQDAAVESETAETVETVEAPLTRADLDAAVAAAVTAALAGNADSVESTESTETEQVTETDPDQLREQLRAELIAEMKRTGLLGRKGLIEALPATDKPLHEMSDEEWHPHQAKTWGAVIPAVR